MPVNKTDTSGKPTGKAIEKCMIATYAEVTYIVEVPCDKDDIDEVIFARAWKQVKEQEPAIPYGHRSAEIIKKVDELLAEE